jgi:hypothetical protein
MAVVTILWTGFGLWRRVLVAGEEQVPGPDQGERERVEVGVRGDAAVPAGWEDLGMVATSGGAAKGAESDAAAESRSALRTIELTVPHGTWAQR